MEYGYKKSTKLSCREAVQKTKEELKKEGFGVLTEIDVKATMKKKLGLVYDNYIILGACNPALANQALQTEKDIGLLLPCNVIVYQDGESVLVSAILPTVAMDMVNNSKLTETAATVEKKLKKAIDNI